MSDSEIDLSEYFEFELRGDKKLLKRPIESYNKERIAPLKTALDRKVVKEEVVLKEHKSSEPKQLCVYCGKIHGPKCLKYVCDICCQRGHYSYECNNTSPESKRESLLEKYKDANFKEAICIECGKLGHITCKESVEELIPWSYIEEYKKIEQMNKQRNEIDIDPYQPLGITLQKVAANIQSSYHTKNEIIKRSYSKYTKRLAQSELEKLCCKCGGEHESEECKENLAREKNVVEYSDSSCNDLLFPN